MHLKDPWEDLRGVKHDGLRRKLVKSLQDCIDFHKLTVYSIDAAERQRFYMMCNLKKPAKSSIRAHVTRMETLNKHLGLLPTTKNSPQAVASTELGNVPFNETTLASIILSHLPVAWRTQYALTHALVPESPRAILVDLENIEKLFAEKANESNQRQTNSNTYSKILANCHFVLHNTTNNTSKAKQYTKKKLCTTQHTTQATHKKTNTMIPPRPSASSGFKIMIGEYDRPTSHGDAQSPPHGDAIFKVIITHSLFYNYLFHVQLISIG